MLIALDFDGVLHDATNIPTGKRMGPPMPGALDAVRALVARGHALVVHTTRGDIGAHVTNWLRYFEFPAMPVTNIKPNADVFIDDRAIRFTDWPSALAAL